jgi:hypothetical protein
MRYAMKHLLLVVLFLFAQAGALAHGVSHLGLHDHDTPVCEQCLAFAPMGAGASSNPPLWQAADAAFIIAAQSVIVSTTGFRPIYQSRAPPFLTK